MDFCPAPERRGVELAAAPPKRPNFFTTLLELVVPPLIFILVLASFSADARWAAGGAQGRLSFTKSKGPGGGGGLLNRAPDEESRVTLRRCGRCG